MSLNSTPSSQRLHIAFFGCRNAGKSSLINAVTGQKLAIVSDIKGTTTDPVEKAMELLPLGPVRIIDTPGIDDHGELGSLRVKKALQVLDKTDLAVLVVDGTAGQTEKDQELLELFRKKGLPFLVAINKKDLCPGPYSEDGHTLWGQRRHRRGNPSAEGKNGTAGQRQRASKAALPFLGRPRGSGGAGHPH